MSKRSASNTTGAVAHVKLLRRILLELTDRFEVVCPDANGDIDPADAQRISDARTAATE